MRLGSQFCLTHVFKPCRVFSGGVKAFEEVAKDKCQCKGAIPDQRDISKIYLKMACKITPKKNVELLPQRKGQSPPKHCSRMSLLLLHKSFFFPVALQFETLALLLYLEIRSSKAQGDGLGLSSTALPQCWHSETSLTNLFSAGSSL